MGAAWTKVGGHGEQASVETPSGNSDGGAESALGRQVWGSE